MANELSSTFFILCLITYFEKDNIFEISKYIALLFEADGGIIFQGIMIFLDNLIGNWKIFKSIIL